MSKDMIMDLFTKYGGTVLVLVVGLIVIKLLLGIERKALSKSTIDGALHVFIVNSSKVVYTLILLVMILSQLNVNTSSIVAVLGACGAAVALALKDSLGNVAGGIIILINKPFLKGDTVEVNGVTGKVDSIDLLTTKLYTFDNKVVMVPNGIITTSILVNYSRENVRRVDCTFAVSYDTDINKAKEILESISQSCPYILEDREPVVGVSSHGDHAVMIDYFVWCPTDKYFDVKYFMMENVKVAFDEAGINIPFPQIDVHVIK